MLMLTASPLSLSGYLLKSKSSGAQRSTVNREGNQQMAVDAQKHTVCGYNCSKSQKFLKQPLYLQEPS